MRLFSLVLAACSIAALVGQSAEAQTSDVQFKEVYELIRQHVTNNYIRPLPPDWDSREPSGQLTSPAELRFAVNQLLSSIGDKTVRLLTEAQVDAYRCQRGYVRTATLTNLDSAGYVKDLESVVDSATEDNHPGFILDLRGISGDDPYLAARLAAPFVNAGEVLSYSNKNGTVNRYKVGRHEGKKSLFITQFGRVVMFEIVNPTPDLKLVVLVDERTSGTAEALAMTLQRHGHPVVGNATSGRSQLLATRVFNVADEQLFVQLPAYTLLADNNQPLSAVSPNVPSTHEDAFQAATDELLGKASSADKFIGLFCLCLAAVLLCRPASNRRGQTATLIADPN